MIKSVAIILMILLWLALFFHRWRKKEPIELSDFARCALSGTILPPLIYCLYVLIVNPMDIQKLHDSIQYLAIGVAIALFVALDNLAKIFFKTRSP